MKRLLFLVSLIICNYSFSQNGMVYPKNLDIKSNELNTYIYEPPYGISIPEKAFINMYYQPFNLKNVPLIKKDNSYEFSIKVPDSIMVLVLTIVDKKMETIDNNSNKGYVIYLKNKTAAELEKAKLAKLGFDGLISYLLKLKITAEETITQFDELYKQNPKLKEDKSYVNYLSLQYQKDKIKYKPIVEDYAESLIKKGEEASMMDAYNIYSWLKQGERNLEIESQILKRFPKGELAKRNFMSGFYNNHEKKTEKFILDELKSYTSTFNDSSENAIEPFYMELLAIYVKNGDTLNMEKMDSHIKNKLKVAYLYNGIAWEYSGQDLVNPGTDLSLAEMISKKAIEIVKSKMSHPTEDDNIFQMQNAYITFTDTYALIMYKQKKYDLAFQYQNEISELSEIDTGGKERYAGYAEKAKGLDFTKAYIEKQLSGGAESSIMLDQLHEIYKKLNIPLADFDRIKENYLKSISQKIKDKVLKKYGNVKGLDFTLVNLAGEKVSLADYKGKVVVLDFWATWCGPCRASFPKMQELVSKYKNKNVEFFFIDVWEKMQPAETKKNVEKFIKDKNYSFNVLFDFKDEIVAKYKIEGIPTKILIDKGGNIVSVDSSIEDLDALIEKNI